MSTPVILQTARRGGSDDHQQRVEAARMSNAHAHLRRLGDFYVIVCDASTGSA
jgi:hypothetical protein